MQTEINNPSSNINTLIFQFDGYETYSLKIKLYYSQAVQYVDQFLIDYSNTGSGIFNNDFSIIGSYLKYTSMNLLY